MQRQLLVAGLAFMATSLAAAPLGAQGSSVFVQSACASGRAGAGVASPCADGSAVLYNPAGLAQRPGAVSAGLTGIWSQHTFTYDRTDEFIERDPRTVPVPQGYVTGRFGNWGVGLGVFAPYGGSIDWPIAFEGRFVTWDQTLRSIYIQPTVAFAVVPRALSIGAGATFVRGSIDLNQRADLADVAPTPGVPLTFGNFGIPRGTDFANINLAGSGWGTGWHVGVLLEPTDWISVGARYMHRVTTDLEGDATITQIPTGLVVPHPANPAENPIIGAIAQLTQGQFVPPPGMSIDDVLASLGIFQGALADQGVQSSVTWPDQAVVGLQVRPVRNLSLLFDYHYFRWSTFDRFPVDFQGGGPDTELVLDYVNAEAFRFGAEYGAPEGLRVRAGYLYNSAASPEGSVSPFLPEGERDYGTVGLGYRFPMGIQADAFYQWVGQVDRRGRTRSPLPGQDPRALNTGVYGLQAHVFGFTLSAQPGFLNR